MAKINLYQRIRDDIRQGRWPRGQLLTQQQLADSYQVSRIPVRDALTQLAAEGWLEYAGKVSLKVPHLTAKEADELCQIRLQLEPFALQQAIPNLNFAKLGQARDILQQAARAPTEADFTPLRLGELNWQFHACLYAASGMPTLLQLLAQLHQKVELYLGVQEGLLGYAAQSLAEHQQLLDLLDKGQAEQAISLLKQHIEAAAAALSRQLLE